MKSLLALLLPFLLVFASPLEAQKISYRGQNLYISGVNVPWHQFGWDFGEHPEWGVAYRSYHFEEVFFQLKNHGVNTARVWIHCDGRANPEFDAEGYVTGFDDNFFVHLDDLFYLAEIYDILLIPCLWSFDMTKDHRKDAGEFAGMHADLITDADKTQSYIDNALIPMVKRYKNHCNLLAWEIINEPEWSMDMKLAGVTTQTVSIEAMQRFVGKCAAAIHQHSDKMVTVGATSLYWNSDQMRANLWNKAAFAGVGLDTNQAYMDFYSVHYYKWMDKLGASPMSKNASEWNLDKPILIAEYPPNELNMSFNEQLQKSKQNNYAGVLPWSYQAKDEYGQWKDFCEIYKPFNIENVSPQAVVNACISESESTDNSSDTAQANKPKSPKQDTPLTSKNKLSTSNDYKESLDLTLDVRTNIDKHLLRLDYVLESSQEVEIVVKDGRGRVVFEGILKGDSPKLQQVNHLIGQELNGNYQIEVQYKGQRVLDRNVVLGIR